MKNIEGKILPKKLKEFQKQLFAKWEKFMKLYRHKGNYPWKTPIFYMSKKSYQELGEPKYYHGYKVKVLPVYWADDSDWFISLPDKRKRWLCPECKEQWNPLYVKGKLNFCCLCGFTIRTNF